jgi:HK97 gp10 family phage protein
MSHGFELEGFDELVRTIEQLEKLPQKVVTKAARQGANIDLKETKQNAPEYTGTLKHSIKLVGERTRIRGKKVYDVTFDRAYNHALVKFSKNGKRSYYPASQEYGYKLRNGFHLEGLRFMRKAVDEKAQEIQQKMVDVLASEIDKLE